MNHPESKKIIPPTMPAGTNLLEVCELSQVVSDAGSQLTILQDINFAVQSGATVAIVGASGSGKSTLLGLLAGLDVPSSGTISWQGQAINHWNEDQRANWRARHLGFVFQSFQLLGHLTALENVLLPLEFSEQTNLANATAEAANLLDKVGLGERLQHFPRQLSGGEQQRVALARAFITRPQLLLADEPTGSLDQAAGERIIELLFELHQTQGSTLILVTHDMTLAARCERQIQLESGRLVADAAYSACEG